MSKYEGMNGSGKVMKKQLGELKKNLIEAHNREISMLKPKQLKANRLVKVSTRTTSFPILEKVDEGEYSLIGSIVLYPESGEFRFSVQENNHAVDTAGSSRTFQALSKFIYQLPKKGNTYGAKTYYWNENDEGEHGHRCPGTTTYYGGWKEPKRYYAQASINR